MARILKWLLFIVLCAAYGWAVFIWPQDKAEAAELEPQEVASDVAIPDYPLDATPTDYLETEEVYSSDEPNGDFDEAVDSELTSEEPHELPEEPTATVDNTTYYAYYVISGSYLDKAPATKAANAYVTSGIASEVLFIDPYYKVVVGKAKSMTEANQLLQNVLDQDISAFIQRN